jgi:hypothetical protein
MTTPQKHVSWLHERDGALRRGDDEPSPTDVRDLWLCARAAKGRFVVRGDVARARRCGELAEEARKAMPFAWQRAAAVLDGANPASGSTRFLGGASPDGERQRHETLGAFKAALSRTR